MNRVVILGATSPIARGLAILNQNFNGAVSLLTLFGNHLESQGSGFMVVIGSVAGERGRQSNYIYGSAKAALATFTEGLRGRMARAGVQVTTVILGLVDTRMTWDRGGSLLTISPTNAA